MHCKCLEKEAVDIFQNRIKSLKTELERALKFILSNFPCVQGKIEVQSDMVHCIGSHRQVTDKKKREIRYFASKR